MLCSCVTRAWRGNPIFPLFPPIPSKLEYWNKTYGWGQSACVLGCSDADHDKNALNFHILDKAIAV